MWTHRFITPHVVLWLSWVGHLADDTVELFEPQIRCYNALLYVCFFPGCWRQFYWSVGILHGSVSHNASGRDGPQSQSGGKCERAGCWHTGVIPLQSRSSSRTVLRTDIHSNTPNESYRRTNWTLLCSHELNMTLMTWNYINGARKV